LLSRVSKPAFRKGESLSMERGQMSVSSPTALPAPETEGAALFELRVLTLAPLVLCGQRRALETAR